MKQEREREARWVIQEVESCRGACTEVNEWSKFRSNILNSLGSPVPASLWQGVARAFGQDSKLEQPGAVTWLGCETTPAACCAAKRWMDSRLHKGCTKSVNQQQTADFIGRSVTIPSISSDLVNNSLSSFPSLLLDPMLFYTSDSGNFSQTSQLGTPATLFTASIPPLSWTGVLCGVTRPILQRASGAAERCGQWHSRGAKPLVQKAMLKPWFRGGFKKTADNILGCVIHSD